MTPTPEDVEKAHNICTRFLGHVLIHPSCHCTACFYIAEQFAQSRSEAEGKERERCARIAEEWIHIVRGMRMGPNDKKPVETDSESRHRTWQEIVEAIRHGGESA